MLYPATPGRYISLLNPSAEVTAAKSGIAGLTFSGTTNWEDGLYWAIRNPGTGQLHSELPELVVFVTDGDPNRNRTTPLTSNDSRIDAIDVDRAAAVANEARGTGARVIGIFVGSSATSPASVDRMKQVVGSVAWDGTGPTDVGNAASADYFIPGGNGAWSELGATLKAIMAAECGGTVTVQKAVDRGSGPEPAAGVWSYTTETGVRELDLAQSASVTFDYPFPSGTTSKAVQITEQAVDGWVLDRVSCTIGGVPVDPARIGHPADGAPGVSLSLQPNEAASCVFVSRPA
jgi:hypothetical protein